MSDRFEGRVAAALRAPIEGSDVRARRAVMDVVRRAATEGHPLPRRQDPWRAGRHSIVGLAFAAGLGGITTLASLLPQARRDVARGVSAAVIGDSVASTLRDTLRLVQLMFDAPAARQVAVAGDFNRWDSRSTPLVRDPVSRQWAVTLALHAGEHRYAFVVDGTRWVPDPRAPQVSRGDDGRVYSLINVRHTAN